MKWFLNIFKYFFYGVYSTILFIVKILTFPFKKKNNKNTTNEIVSNTKNSETKKSQEDRKIDYSNDELRKLPVTKRLFKVMSMKLDSSSNKSRKAIEKQALSMEFSEEDTKKSEKKQTYIYEARDLEGKYIKGKFDAYSKADVHSFLMNEGYEVYAIKTSSFINFVYGSSSVMGAKYNKKELTFFLTQLSTYIKAGIPLIDAIRIFAKQERKTSKKKILQAIVYELVMGEAFSNALEKQGNAFPKLLINMIKTSEMTGELAETLDDMANYYEEMEKTRKQMISAMTYPSIVFVMSIAIITFIMLFVIPQFVDIYDDMQAKVPPFTLFVISISDFLGKNWPYVFGGVILFIGLVVLLFKKIKLFRAALQYIAMRMPVFGKIIIYNEVAMFTKTFGSLLNHNVFITDSMEILSKITNNEIYKSIINDTLNNLSKGESISTAFKDHWAFPVVAYEMIITGERTGELGKMMNKVSRFYQEQHTNLITQMKSFIEPLMIAFLALLVGGLLLAVVIPMFSLYNQM